MLKVFVAGLLLVTLGTNGDIITDPVGHAFSKNPSYFTQDERIGGENPILTIDGLGTARGVLQNTFEGNDMAVFRSIPFAHKPVRFQYPVMYDDMPWPTSENGEYDATRFRNACPQGAAIGGMDEDCLHVTIYTPITNFSTPAVADKAVMVFIHGGAYLLGEATYYIPNKLLDRDVIVAVIQYRLGTTGFLYSGTPDAPGNMGLMDQITALRWVQKYISYFGGDKDKVTVFGQSAGGASTSWMQMTPLTNAEHNGGSALAKGFIAMSGSALEYWTLDHAGKDAFLLQVEEAGCNIPGYTEAEMVQCMTDLPIEEVVAASLRVYEQDRLNGGLGFIGQVPVIQTELLGVLPEADIVIPEDPMVALQNGRFSDAPLMTGATRDEGSLVVSLLYRGYLDPLGLMNDTDFLRDDLLTMVASAFGITDNTKSVPNSYRLAFFPSDVEMGVWDEMKGPLVDLGGMMFLKSGLWNMAHERQRFNSAINSYFYSFEFESDEVVLDLESDVKEGPVVVAGITHGADLPYLIKFPSLMNARKREMVKRMTTLYSNFAKFGNPTPAEVRDEPGQWGEFTEEWQPYNPEEKPFMLLADEITLENDFVLRWNYNKYGYPHQNTTKQL